MTDPICCDLNEAISSDYSDGGGYRCTTSSGGVADDDEACAAAEYPAACAGSCEQPDECNEACDVTKAYFTTSVSDDSGTSKE